MTGHEGVPATPESLRPTVATVLGRDESVEAVRREARLALIAAPDSAPARVRRALRSCRSGSPGLEVVVVRDRACRLSGCARPPAELVVEPSDITPELLATTRAEILVAATPVPATGPVVLGMARGRVTGAQPVTLLVHSGPTRSHSTSHARRKRRPVQA